MDFFTLILFCGFGLLLWQIVQLRARVGNLEGAARTRLEQDPEARAAVAGEGPAGPLAAAPTAASPTRPPTPVAVAPWAAPPRSRGVLEPAAHSAGHPIRPAAAATAAATASAGPAGALWGPAPRATRPEPAGPGATVRVLERLGLSPTKDGQLVSRTTIEAWLEGRMLAVVGGIALTLGAAFFLSLAFSRGWITEPMRVLIGLAGGTLAIGLGELAFLKLRGIVGHVLLAVGLAVISLSLFAATRLFELIPPEAGVAGALVAALVAAVIAIRHDSELVAAFGLVSVLVAPPLLGASPTVLTTLFLATALVGTTAIALFRTWIWLPPLAFLLAAPQVASSATGSESVAVALLTVAGFWLLNTIAAGGEEIRHPADKLRPTTVTLLLASAAFTLWAGMTILDGAYADWRGSFVAAVAVAHLLIGLGLLARFGDRHPFGLVVAATGVASITMAAPIQLGAPWVPVAWAAEAVALTWVAKRYAHPYAGGAAVVIGFLALAHLLLIEYPVNLLTAGFDRTWPFLGPEGLTFAFVAAAALAAGVIVRIAWIGGLLAIVTILTTAYVLPFETSGTLLVAAWSALTVGAMAAWRFAASNRLPRHAGRRTLDLGLPVRAKFLEDAVLGVRDLVRPVFALTVPVAILAAAGHLVAFEYPVWTLGSQLISGVPYISLEGLAAAAVICGVLLTGVLGKRPVLIAAAGFGLMVLIYSLAFEVLPPWVMIPWGVATVGSIALVRRVVGIEPQLTGPASATALAERVPFAAAAFGLLCMVVDAVLYAPLDDFVDLLSGTSAVAGIAFVDELTVALVVLAATLLAAGAVWGGVRARAAGIVAAGLAVAWLLPFEVRPSLAVAGWAAIAAGGFALIRRVPTVRILVGIPSVGLLTLGVVVALVVVAPPSRLVVDAATVVTGLAILTDATIALVSLALACALGVYLHRAERVSLWGAVAAATLLLYAASVAVVDVFQQQVGTRSLEDLQREAQVALSLLWSALGGIAFVAGLVTRLGPVRRAGLVLLGLATAKVFLVDLASLDVAYRVLSLVGLGVLMLLSSIAYARHQQREAATVDP